MVQQSYTYDGRLIESRVYDLSKGAIFNDIEGPLPRFQGHSIL